MIFARFVIDSDNVQERRGVVRARNCAVSTGKRTL